MPLRNARPGFKIGTAVQARHLEGNASYRNLVASEFDLLIPENEMKMNWICKEPGAYDFTDADAIVDFAQKHQQSVRGHSLCWHPGAPRWFHSLSDADLEQTLKSHIQTTVDRYRGKCYAWDVVSEAYPNSIWSRIDNCYAKCFQWAREADPDAKLIYLDHRLHLPNRVLAVHRLVSRFKSEGVPIDGVGIQFHYELFRAIGLTFALPAIVRQLQQLGVFVEISEVSIPIFSPTQQLPDTTKFDIQAKAYAQLLKAALSSGCLSFSVWGLHDNCCFYKPPERDPASTPCIFDPNYQPKPAYDAIAHLLRTW